MIFPPSGEYFTAFDKRFINTCPILSLSTNISTSPSGSSISRVKFSIFVWSLNISTAPGIASPTLHQTLLSENPSPDSIRLISNRSFIIAASPTACLLIYPRYFSLSSFFRFFLVMSISENPWIEVKGVLSSCAAVDMNSVFIRSISLFCVTSWKIVIIPACSPLLFIITDVLARIILDF